MNDENHVRYCSRPFPPYTYVPGSGTPHPVSDERGHMHGLAEVTPLALDSNAWFSNETYLYAIDLFNHSFFWESHEAWESLWHVAGHRGEMADFLKGLIKLAAAGVKQYEGNTVGIERHLLRARELMASVGHNPYAGIDLQELIARIDKWLTEPNPQLSLDLAPVPPRP